MWLEKKGILLVSSSAMALGPATVEIFEGTAPKGEPVTWTHVNNYYNNTFEHMTWTGVGDFGLVAGRTYFAECTIRYGGSDGMLNPYKVTVPFSVPTSQKVFELTQKVEQLAWSIEASNSAVRNAVMTQTNTVIGQTQAIANKIGTSIDKALDESLRDVTSEVGRVLTATGVESLPTRIETMRTQVVDEITREVEPHIVSGIVNRETVVKEGESVTIKYRAESGLSPVVTVYDPNNLQKVSNAPMKEIGKSGVYEYDVKFDKVGDYTVLTSEPTRGTMDAMTMTALNTSLQDVSSQVSAIMGSTSRLSSVDDTMTTLDAQLATIMNAIGSLANPGGELSEGLEKTVESMLDPVVAALRKVASDMQSLGGAEGFNLDDVYEVSDKQSKDIKALSNKTIELRNMLEFIRDMMNQKFSDEPVIKTWYESGSVILKVLIANPSKTLTRKVPFKYYLPKEVKKDHIMDKEDLDLGYDTQQSLYYVYKDVELKPNESRRLYVEIEDIWVIDGKEIVSLKQQAQKFSDALVKGPYAERSGFLKKEIDRRLDDITRKQNEAVMVNPEEHISTYRENIKVLAAVKEDILELERLANRVMRVAPMATWKMIIAIIGFLAVLSIGFFIFWQSKLKDVNTLTSDASSQPKAEEKPIEAENREHDEQKVDIDDIKKKLEEGG